MKYLNLALLVLFPVAWFAPLMNAAVMPLFGMTEITVLSGLQSLWETDVAFALIVSFLALFAPYAKVLGLALIHWHLASPRILGALHVMGKLAMAEIFLLALYIVLAKGVGMVTIETDWGLYLLTACVIGSMVLGLQTKDASHG